MSDTHDVIISGFDLDRIEAELDAVTKQRDKLAEALERIDDYLSRAEDVMHGAGSDYVTIARGMIAKSLSARAMKGGDDD